MPCSPAQLAANRANARKSTGPRTVRGKRVASRNSIKLGVYCEHAVVPGESKLLFELCRQEVIRDMQPQSSVELFIVDRIAIAQWKLRRLQSAEMAFYRGGYERMSSAAMNVLEEHSDYTEEQIQMLGRTMSHNPDMPGRIALEGISDDLEKLSRMEQRLEHSIHRWISELERVRKISEKSKDLPRSMYDRCAETQQEVKEVLERGAKTKSREVANEQAESRAGVTRASRPCAERESLDNGGSQEPLAHSFTGETPVSQVSDAQNEANAPVDHDAQPSTESSDEEASNMQNEPNDLLEHYEPIAVELRRRERIEAGLDTKPEDDPVGLLGVPVKQFDGMSVPYIRDEAKRIKQEGGVSVDGVEKVVWDAAKGAD